MKTLGLIGGTSWESTHIYYQLLNEEVSGRLGGLNSAPSLIYSFNFKEIADLQEANQWSEVSLRVLKAAQTLERSGADALLLCSNSIHRVVPQIEPHLKIPIINIIDVTASRAKALNMTRIGLLGTRYTLQSGFFQQRLEEVHGLEVVLPSEYEQGLLHKMILQELCRGEIHDASEAEFLLILDELENRGAQAVILGCTELALLMRDQSHHVPLLDGTKLHVEYAVDWMLGELPGGLG